MSVLRQTLCFCVLLPGLVQGADFHVRAGSSGDGSVGDPFGTLEAAERASAPNDRIFLHAAPEPLAGSIALKPGQKLLRHGQNDVTLSNASTRRPIVRLARDTEVQGLGFINLHADAITGGEQAISGTVLHENHFSGSTSAESEDGIWAIRIDTSEDVEDFVATDNQVSDGVDLGGVQILQHGNSRGSYRFERNTFNDLGHRAHHFWSLDNARLDAEVLSSRADNIGLGEKNSDSILPHLSHHSEQKIVVRDYHYKNSDGVGNASNTGLEAFIMGAPFEGEEFWCDGCRLTLLIENSLFEAPITDGIQLINFGSNATMNVTIRGTTVLRPKPQQVGGGISLWSQTEQNSGNRVQLKVEQSQVIGSSGYSVAVRQQGDDAETIVDLGGGSLDAAGNNRFVDNAAGALSLEGADAMARNNWWGRSPPKVTVSDGNSADLSEPLVRDPGS